MGNAMPVGFKGGIQAARKNDKDSHRGIKQEEVDYYGYD